MYHHYKVHIHRIDPKNLAALMAELQDPADKVASVEAFSSLFFVSPKSEAFIVDAPYSAADVKKFILKAMKKYAPDAYYDSSIDAWVEVLPWEALEHSV